MTETFPFPAGYAHAVADSLRAHGWMTAIHWHCGCSPVGLCPTHTRMRDEEQR